jgi:hypothetical protein
LQQRVQPVSLLDPTSDYEVFDDSVRIDLTTADGTSTVYDILARKSGLTDRDIMAAGVSVGVDDTVFTMYAETLEGLIPQPEYVVTDASSVKWTVLSIAVSSYRDVPVSYRAVARKQV